MRILVDIGHPAHVHFFRNPLREWEKLGFEIAITASARPHVTELLAFYGFNFVLASRENREGKLRRMVAVFSHSLNVARIARLFKPDVVLSVSSPMAAWASAFTGTPHITFDDTEHAKLEHWLYLPFTKLVYTPSSFIDDLGPKQRRYAGYHELAYLHPNRFSPNPNSLKTIGLRPGDVFFIVRLVSWSASHDIGQRGFRPGEPERLFGLLQNHGKVIISSEREKITRFLDSAEPIPAALMHDLLYYATLYIGEGGTMSTEAALLGTPAIFVSTLMSGNWIELENKYGLMYSFQKGELAIAKAATLLTNKRLEFEWAAKRERLLTDKIDVTQYVVEQIQKSIKNQI